MDEVSFSRSLDKSFTKQQWPDLEKIVKQLQQYIARKTKNREYLDAQKAKQKLVEAQLQIKARNAFNNQMLLKAAILDLEKKHQKQKAQFQQNSEFGIKKFQQCFIEAMNLMKNRHKQQKDKQLQQLQASLPKMPSPDKEQKKLRLSEEEYAKHGNFIKAQAMKEKIEKRQIKIREDYLLIRDNNIKLMMSELEQKQAKEEQLAQGKHFEKIQQLRREQARKGRDLDERQARQFREVKWFYQERVKGT